jgi:cytochrome P450
MAADRPTAPELTRLLVDPGFYAEDPFPLYARLRHEAPVVWHDDPGFWVLSRHRDVLEVSRQPGTFCSGRGVLLMDLGRELPDVPGALLYVDPPEHQRYRRLIQPAFGPARTRALEGAVRQRARQLVGNLPAGEPVDVVAALAVPLPLMVIAELLGLPPDEWPRYYDWSEAAIEAGSGQSEANLAGLAEMADHLLEAVAERRRHPGGDLLSALATSEVDGDRLDDGELLMLCIQLLVAGNETTRNLLSGGLVALAQHPDQWAGLVAEPGLAVPATEELLRWTTPVISFLRTATQEAVVGGQVVAEGDPLMLLYPSANRDEAEFGPSADRLDLTRDPNHQLAFGFGEHFCVGAALARLEGSVVLEEVVRRFTTIEVAAPPQRLASMAVVAGITRADLVFA